MKTKPLFADLLFLVSEPNKKAYVSYTRFPNTRLEYLPEGEAERRILRGEEINRACVMSLTREGFIRAARALGKNAAGAVTVEENRVTLHRSIAIKESVVVSMDLSEMTVNPPAGEPALDVSFAGMPQRVPTEFLTRINLHHTHFSGPVVIRDALFHRRVILSQAFFQGPVDLSGTVFMDAADLSGSRFVGSFSCTQGCFSRFSLENARFLDRAVFKYTLFSGDAELAAARFEKPVSFEYSHFDGLTNFQRVIFDDTAAFRVVSFASAVSFVETHFKQPVSYIDSVIKKVRFTRATFEQTLSVGGTAAGEIGLEDAVFLENVLLFADDPRNGITAVRDNLGGMTALIEQIGSGAGDALTAILTERLSLIERMRQHILEIVKTAERHLPVDLIRLEGLFVKGEFRCAFHNIAPGTSSRPTLASHRLALQGTDATGWERAGRVYGWLKEQYRKQGAYGDEDAAHWWASECVTLSATGPKRLANLFYRSVLGYGVKLTPLITTMVLVLIFFWIVFTIGTFTNGIFMTTSATKLYGFIGRTLNAFYFSCVTYLTIGYGDVTPRGIYTLFAVIEGALGVFLNAAFVVMIFRKIIR